MAKKTSTKVKEIPKESTKAIIKPLKKANVPSKLKTETKSPIKANKKKVIVEDEHFTLFTEFDIYLFKQGKHFKLYSKLGAHLVDNKGVNGTYFAVWAPNASHVSVIGDFNDWNPEPGRMSARLDSSGIWEVFIPGVKHGDLYKFMLRNAQTGQVIEKFDPFAYNNEIPPKRASIVWDISHKRITDKLKSKRNKLNQPWSVYEVHAGSWRKPGADEEVYYSYTDLIGELVPYVKEMGFTHIEFLPLTEHPFAGSWGYQTTGFFASSSRFGTPQEFMKLIDAFHAENIGVILDWVPSHFPDDSFALAEYDGSRLYEHPDPKKGYHPDWKSLIFNYERYEVRSFLISSAMFWVDKYDIDGIRVDAVASMIYLDYSRDDGGWNPNIYGGNENLEAISFLKELNQTLYENFPEIQVIAEESTSWPMITRPVSDGGLGFGMKWMMGWMHDTLKYFGTDPIYREFHQHDITFSIYYAFSENFMLPLSHDEVVHGKGSLIQKMPGNEWQKFGNLRAMISCMFTHPGSKLLFMGSEIAQYKEWNYKESLDWDLLKYEHHQGVQDLVKQLNHLYKTEPALYEKAFSPDGFEWIDFGDNQNSTISYIRKGNKSENDLIVIANLTPIARENYRIGLPSSSSWKLIFNSDDLGYKGTGLIIPSTIKSEKTEKHSRKYSGALTLPPLSVLILKSDVKKPVKSKK